MNKAKQTVIGLALVAIGGFAFVGLPERGDWASVVVIGLGAHFISQSLVSDALRSAASFLKDIGWRGKSS